MKNQPTGLLGLVLSVHKGERKLSDVRPGMKKKIERMLREMTHDQIESHDLTKRSEPKHFDTGQNVRLRAVKHS